MAPTGPPPPPVLGPRRSLLGSFDPGATRPTVPRPPSSSSPRGGGGGAGAVGPSMSASASTDRHTRGTSSVGRERSGCAQLASGGLSSGSSRSVSRYLADGMQEELGVCQRVAIGTVALHAASQHAPPRLVREAERVLQPSQELVRRSTLRAPRSTHSKSCRRCCPRAQRIDSPRRCGSVSELRKRESPASRRRPHARL